MNTNIENQNELSGQLLGNLHLQELNSLISTTTPELSLEVIRRRADATHAAVSKTGRFEHAHWGIICLLLALGMVSIGIFLPWSTNTLGVLGGIAFAAGLLLICLFNPRQVLRHLEAFDLTCNSVSQEWTAKAAAESQGRFQAILIGLYAFPNVALMKGASVSEIIEALNAASARAGALGIDLEQQLASEVAGGRAAEEEYALNANRARVKARTWASRIRARPVRQAAHRALDAREAMLVRKRLTTTLQTASEKVLRPLNQALGELIQHFCAGVQSPLTQLQDAAGRTLTELANYGSRDLFSKLIPPVDHIEDAAREATQQRIVEVFRSAADANEGASVEEIVKEKVEGILAASAAVPERVLECLQTLNGDLGNVLAQLEAESCPFSVVKTIPGREQWRLRTVLVADGTSSSLFKAVEQRSEGCICRAIDHDREDEVIVVTEERSQPASEFPDLAEAAKALDGIPKHLRAAMVVAVDDDDLVLTQCRPEQRTDPMLGVRLLALGLAFECVQRRGDIYSLNGAPHRNGNHNGDGNNRIGRGFRPAVELLNGDPETAERLQLDVTSAVERRGAEGACKAIDAALTKRDLVPAEHVGQVRQILVEERRRLRDRLT